VTLGPEASTIRPQKTFQRHQEILTRRAPTVPCIYLECVLSHPGTLLTVFTSMGPGNQWNPSQKEKNSKDFNGIGIV